MKLLLKIMLWVSWLFTMWAGTQLLGFGIFAPVMTNPGTGMGLSMQVFAQQVLVLCGGQGRILAVGAACVLLAILCRKLLRHLRQTESDQLAQQILNSVRAGKDPSRPFFLYLRAFETTRRLKAPLFLMDMATMGLSRLWTGELESFINEALIKAGPLIALGHPGEIFGAGRVTTSDDAWMSDITLLAAKARGILLIPSHRPGTLWEIEHLEREGLLAKTILVMPPESRRFNWKSHWSQARRVMGTLGGMLPEYDELGMLFTMEPVRGVCGVEAFSLFFGRSLRKSVLKLLERRDQNVDINRALQRAHRSARRSRLIGRLNVLTRGGAYAVLGLVLVFGGSAGPPPYEKLSWHAFGDRFQNAVAIEEQQTAIENDFGDSPVYQQLADPLSHDQRAELRTEMTHAGFRRLTDTQLRTAFAAVSQLLARADTKTCGAFVRHTLPHDQIDQAMLKVDQSLVSDWLDVSSAAATAELHQQPPAPVSYLALIEAKHRFEASLDARELSRLQMLSLPDASRSIDDDCWMARKSYSAVQTLPAPYNLAWARLLEMKGERPVVHALVSHPLEKLKELPAFQTRAHGLSDEQVQELFSDMAGKGVARLDDASLVARYSAMSELLAKLDEPACEDFALGAVTTHQWEVALGGISDSGQAGFLDSQYRAAQAELEQVKPIVLSDKETQAANEAFASTFHGSEVDRVNQLGSGAHPSRETSCWMVRKDFAAVTKLEEPYNQMWARVLAQVK